MIADQLSQLFLAQTNSVTFYGHFPVGQTERTVLVIGQFDLADLTVTGLDALKNAVVADPEEVEGGPGATNERGMTASSVHTGPRVPVPLRVDLGLADVVEKNRRDSGLDKRKQTVRDHFGQRHALLVPWVDGCEGVHYEDGNTHVGETLAQVIDLGEVPDDLARGAEDDGLCCGRKVYVQPLGDGDNTVLGEHGVGVVLVPVGDSAAQRLDAEPRLSAYYTDGEIEQEHGLARAAYRRYEGYRVSRDNFLDEPADLTGLRCGELSGAGPVDVHASSISARGGRVQDKNSA